MNAKMIAIWMTLVAMGLCGACGAQTWQTVYQTDFSSDPGWTTNSPTHCFWDPSDGTFHIDQENVNFGGGFACYDVGSAGGSFWLCYDIMMLRGDYASGLSFGVYDSDFNAEDYGSFVQVIFVTDDRGRNVLMSSRNASNVLSYDWDAGVPWIPGRWYSVSMEYHADTGSFTCTVTDRDTGMLVGTKSATVGPFSPDMSYIGNSNIREGTFQCPGAHSTAKIDNVVFSVESTASQINATVNIDPDVLNLGSAGKYITCYITLPTGYDVSNVDPVTIVLNGQFTPAWSTIEEQEQVLTVKFSRSDLQAVLQPGQVQLTVTGLLTNGTLFEGADTIFVINPSKP
jgi:hypothetical protein